jgi:hypothetical protein
MMIRKANSMTLNLTLQIPAFEPSDYQILLQAFGAWWMGVGIV